MTSRGGENLIARGQNLPQVALHPRVWEQCPYVLLRHGLALRTGGCVEKIIKRESRVVVANGRTGGDREVPKQPAR